MADLHERLEAIRRELAELRELDTERVGFGADVHDYALEPTLSEAEVAAFEARFGCRLPVEYRAFIMRVGNGLAGPNYGLNPLGQVSVGHSFAPWVDADSSEWRHGDPSRPFPHAGPWDLSAPKRESFAEGADFEEALAAVRREYWQRAWLDGALPLSDAGCGILDVLVLNGPFVGQVWRDNRASSMGIAPATLESDRSPSFLNWYEDWLSADLSEVR